MIKEYICYKCRCEKCHKEWITKTHDVPAKCPDCKRVTWNEGCAPAPDPESAQISQPTQPIADERKSVLNALQAKIDAIQDHNIEPEHQDDDSWIEMDTTIENGETLYWHRKPKGRPICYRKEVNWDSFA